MFLTLVIAAVVIVSISIIGLGVSIFFRKSGKFPETGVGHNPEMRKLGLSCAKADELKSFQLQNNIRSTKSGSSDSSIGNSGCAGCNCS